MHRLLHIIALAALVMLLSCRHGHGPARGLLERAEALTPSRPDSALALLESIPATSLHPGEETALHALLLTQARYKCMYDETDDSLIRIATSWYDTHRDTRHRMLANFYLGYILMNRGSYGESVRHMLLAEDLATQLKDTFQLGIIYRNLCIIFGNANIGQQEIHYARKSADCLRAIGKTEYAREALLNLAKSLYNSDSVTQALPIAEMLLSEARLASDTAMSIEIHKLQAYANLKRGSYDKAISYFDSVSALNGALTDRQDLYNYMLANVMVSDIGRVDSLTGECPSEDLPFEYWARKGDYKKAYEEACKAFREESDILATLTRQQLSSVVEDFNKQKADSALHELSRQRQTVYMLMIIFTLLSFAVGSYIYFKRKNRRLVEDNLVMTVDRLVRETEEKDVMLSRKEAQLTQNLMELHRIQDALNEKTGELNSKEMELASRDKEIESLGDNLLRQYFENIRWMCSEYFKAREDDGGRERMVQAIRKHVEDFGESAEIKTRLTELADKHTNGIIESFNVDFPGLSDSDKRFFLFNVCGFDMESISLFMKSNPRALATRKSRLKAKINASTVTYRDIYLSKLK